MSVYFDMILLSKDWVSLLKLTFNDNLPGRLLLSFLIFLGSCGSLSNEIFALEYGLNPFLDPLRKALRFFCDFIGTGA